MWPFNNIKCCRHHHKHEIVSLTLHHKIHHRGTYTVRGKINMTAPLVGVPVNTTVTFPDGTVNTGTTVTSDTGAYSFTFFASQAGVYGLTVGYLGDANTTPAMVQISMVVKAVPVITLSAPDADVKVGDTVVLNGTVTI